MFCSQCGTKNDDSAKFCSSCGTATVASPPLNPTTPNVTSNHVAENVTSAFESTTPTAPAKKTSKVIIFGGGFIAIVVGFGLYAIGMDATNKAKPIPATAPTVQTKTSVIDASELIEHHMECLFLYDTKSKLAKNGGDTTKYDLLLDLAGPHARKIEEIKKSNNYPEADDDRILKSVNAKFLKLLKDGAITEEFLAAVDALSHGCHADLVADKTANSSSREVFEYVSKNIWTVWDGVCKQKPRNLSATYSLDAGQRLFENGIQFQDMTPNARGNTGFEFSFDVPSGFKYRQIARHVSDNSVVVTDITEVITLISKDMMRVATESLNLDLEQFDRDGTKRYLKKRSSRIEILCNP